MRRTNPYTTVTRQGDRFTYQHKIVDKEPTNVSLTQVFQAASYFAEKGGHAVCALKFLSNSLGSIADHGQGLDEYGVRGMSVLCDMISEAINVDNDDYRAESGIIEEMACRGEI